MKAIKRYLLDVKNKIYKIKAKVALFSILALILLITIPPYFYSLLHQLLPTSSSANVRRNVTYRSCDIFKGRWVRDPKAPYYTNESCWAIHDNQNCMKYGRPDNDFMKWRWKPDQCELPTFNPAQFLEIVRGKSMAFVGDSLGRNQMQALMCQLLRVTYVEDVSPTTDYKSRTWLFRAHNFTLANFWSPFLVNAKEAEPNGDPLNGLYNLYLDEPDKNWTTHINKFDYVIISAGQWFFRPVMHYENNKLIGCYSCNQANINNLTMYYGYAKAFRTSFKALYGLNGFKGMTFLRTFSPAHFENGEWNKGGNCIRKTPLKSNETSLSGFMLETYMTQIEEFKDAAREAKRRGLKFRLLDITEVMLLRADGHPSIYGHWPHEKVLQYNDCVHWCLPGPVDVWNDFLLEILKKESLNSFFSYIAKRAKNEAWRIVCIQ